MKLYVALLRGINVYGSTVIPSDGTNAGQNATRKSWICRNHATSRFQLAPVWSTQ